MMSKEPILMRNMLWFLLYKLIAKNMTVTDKFYVILEDQFDEIISEELM